MNALTPTRREILSVLFKEKILLAVVFFALLFFVILVSYIMTPSYEADAKILVGGGREFQTTAAAGEGQVVPPYLTKQEVINSELEILNSNDLIASVINQIGMAKIYPSIASDPPSNMRPIDAAIKAFNHDYKVQAAAMSEVIALTYFNQDRDIAIQTLSTLIKLYQEKHAAVYGANHSGFYDQELKSYDDKLDELTRKIGDLRQKDSLFDVNAQRAQLIQDQAGVADALRAVESRSVDAHGRIAYYTQRLKSLTPLTIQGDVPSDSVETAKSKVLDLTTQIQTMKQRYASDVKPIKDAEEQVRMLQAFIDGNSASNHKTWMQRDPAYDDANLKLQAAQADASSVDAQIALQRKNLADINARLDALEDGARALESMERDHSMLDDLARNARQRFEDARTNEEMDKLNVVSINILEQPDASTKPAKPNHVVFALVGFALGLLGMGGVMLYTLMFRGSFITAESVERLLGIQVLCVIPEVAEA